MIYYFVLLSKTPPHHKDGIGMTNILADSEEEAKIEIAKLHPDKHIHYYGYRDGTNTKLGSHFAGYHINSLDDTQAIWDLMTPGKGLETLDVLSNLKPTKPPTKNIHQILIHGGSKVLFTRKRLLELADQMGDLDTFSIHF